MGQKWSRKSADDAQQRKSLSLWEVQQIKSMFEDEGVRGKVSQEQLKRLLGSLGVDFIPSNVLYRMFDVNHDGQVGAKEFIQMLSMFMYGSAEELTRFLFNFYDSNGDGSIDQEELQALFELIGVIEASLSPREGSSGPLGRASRKVEASAEDLSHRAMSRFDHNSDGTMSFDEFHEFVRANSRVSEWTHDFSERTKSGFISLREHDEERLVRMELERLMEEEAIDDSSAAVEQASFDVTKSRLNLAESVDENQDMAKNVLHSTREIDKYRIPYDAITFSKLLGSGANAEVFAAEWLGLPVAVKVIKEERRQDLVEKADGGDSSGGGMDALRQMFESELKVLGNLRHPNTMLYLGAVLEPDKPMCIVTELMSGGSLYSYLHDDDDDEGKSRNLPYIKRVLMALEICRGVLYLHARLPAVLHRDLKSENVLIDGASGRAVVSDFGLSITAKDPAAAESLAEGTAATMAPELVDGEPYTTASDVYSVAIILWELMTGRVPYEGMRAPTILFKVSMEDLRPEFLPEDDVSEDLKELITSMWAADPQDRPPIVNVVEELREELSRDDMEPRSAPPPAAPLHADLRRASAPGF